MCACVCLCVTWDCYRMALIVRTISAEITVAVHICLQCGDRNHNNKNSNNIYNNINEKIYNNVQIQHAQRLASWAIRPLVAYWRVVFMPRMRQNKNLHVAKTRLLLGSGSSVHRLPTEHAASQLLDLQQLHHMAWKNRFCGKFTHSYGPFVVHELRATTSCYRCAAFTVQPMS